MTSISVTWVLKLPTVTMLELICALKPTGAACMELGAPVFGGAYVSDYNILFIDHSFCEYDISLRISSD